MAYSTEADAGFRVTALKHGSTSMGGPLQSTHEKIVDDEAIKAGAANNPVARPVDAIDARVVYRFHDIADVMAETTSPANCTTELTAADGGSGSFVHGPMAPRGYVNQNGRNQNGFYVEQEHRHAGSALTETPTI